MAIEVFNRYENKYILDTFTYTKIRGDLSQRMELDAYNRGGACYTICNLYYDAEDSTLIRTSLGKPKYKEKLRLRAYGVPALHDMVFIEIKKKVNGIVNKRRTQMKLSEAYAFLSTKQKPETKPYMNEQVVNEISYLIRRIDLAPKTYLAYDRIAYFDKENRGLRISFDANIRARREDVRLELGSSGKRLMEPQFWLMEIKTENALPYWVTEMLAKHQVYSTSFSKYGTEYKNFVAKNLREERIPCSISYLPTQQIPCLRPAVQF